MIIILEPTFDTHNYIIPVTAVTLALVVFYFTRNRRRGLWRRQK